jgi:hypothetical protein
MVFIVEGVEGRLIRIMFQVVLGLEIGEWW